MTVWKNTYCPSLVKTQQQLLVKNDFIVNVTLFNFCKLYQKSSCSKLLHDSFLQRSYIFCKTLTNGTVRCFAHHMREELHNNPCCCLVYTYVKTLSGQLHSEFSHQPASFHLHLFIPTNSLSTSNFIAQRPLNPPVSSYRCDKHTALLLSLTQRDNFLSPLRDIQLHVNELLLLLLMMSGSPFILYFSR